MKELISNLNIVLNLHNRLKLVSIIFLGLLVSILEMIGIGIIPIYLGFILEPDKINNFLYFHSLKNLVNSTSIKNLFIYISIIIIIFFIIKNLIIFYLNIFQANFFKNLNISNSKKLFELYIKSPILDIKNINSSIAQRNITGEVFRASKFIEAIISIIRELFIVIALLILLLIVDLKSTLIVLFLLMIFSIVYQNLIKSKIIKISKKAQKESGQINKIIFHTFGAIKTTKILNKEQYFINNFNYSIKNIENQNFWMAILSKLPKLILEVFAVLTIITIVFFLYTTSSNNLGQSLAFLVLLGAAFVKLFPSISAINNYSTNLRSTSISFNLLINEIKKYSLFNKSLTLKTIKDVSDNDSKVEFKKEILLKNIFFKYPGSQKYILENISLNIKNNNIIGIFGRSGSGKSTLLDLITYLIEPSKGEIIIDGKTLKDGKNWQKNIGYITQDTYLLDQSIKNNIAFGEKDEDIDMNKVKKAISLSQLQEFVDNLPDGIESLIGEKGSKISGGQVQRIAIARALYRKNGLIILDESTNSLDQTTENYFLDDLVKLKKICTIIIVSHKIETLKICDQKYEIKDKTIIKHT